MANPFYQTIITHTSGNDGLYMADWAQAPFNLSYAVEVPGGVTTSFIVQFTLDDLNDATVTPTWFNDVTNGTAQAGNAVGAYNFPVRAIRVNVSSLSGGVASIRFAVLQGSSAR